MYSTACCSGSVHQGQPQGITGNLHGLPTYITEPSNGAEIKGIIVIIPDAWGWEFVNLRLLADTFAERISVRCLLPDFMNGTCSPRYCPTIPNIRSCRQSCAYAFTDAYENRD